MWRLPAPADGPRGDRLTARNELPGGLGQAVPVQTRSIGIESRCVNCAICEQSASCQSASVSAFPSRNTNSHFPIDRTYLATYLAAIPYNASRRLFGEGLRDQRASSSADRQEMARARAAVAPAERGDQPGKEEHLGGPVERLHRIERGAEVAHGRRSRRRRWPGLLGWRRDRCLNAQPARTSVGIDGFEPSGISGTRDRPLPEDGSASEYSDAGVGDGARAHGQRMETKTAGGRTPGSTHCNPSAPSVGEYES